MSNKDASKGSAIKKEAVEEMVGTGNMKGEKRLVSDDEANQLFKKSQREPSYFDDKPVIEKGVTGRVKWYNIRFRYGFISRDDNPQNDVYVHQTAITKSRMIKYYLRTLANDEEVLFDIIEGIRGREAANVTGPDGKEVRGRRFNNMHLHSVGRRYAYSRGFRRTGSADEDDAQVEGNRKNDVEQLHPEGDQQKEEKGFRRRFPRSYLQRQNKQQLKNEEDGNDDAREEKKADIDSRLDDNKKRFRHRRRFPGVLRPQHIYKPNSANEGEHSENYSGREVVKNTSTNAKKIVSGGEEDEEIADIVKEMIETLVLDL